MQKGPEFPPAPAVIHDRSRRLFYRSEAGIEGFVLRGHVAQQLVGLEALAIFGGEVVAAFHAGGSAHRVDVRNRAAGEGREAPTEDRADIGIAWVGNDA